MDRCEECGFEYDLSHPGEAAAYSITSGVEKVAATLGRTDVDLRSRRQPGQWSPLEYGCHLRDVLLVQRERVFAGLISDRPSLEAMGRDERAVHDGYANQDLDDVAGQLTVAAQMFANLLSQLKPDEWDRCVVYNYPHQAERSLRWVAVHTLHEVTHHLLDVRRQIGM